jgi:hypothetical protein
MSEETLTDEEPESPWERAERLEREREEESDRADYQQQMADEKKMKSELKLFAGRL